MIELTVYGEPAQCRSAATDVEGLTRALSSAGDDVTSVGSRSKPAWTGMAGEAFRGRLADLDGDLDELRSRTQKASRALDVFATRLTDVKHQMASVRSMAVGGGLTVTGDVVQPPTTPTGPVAPAAATHHDALVRTYNRAFDLAEDARRAELTAHHDLQQAMEDVTADGFVDDLLEKLGLIPTGSAVAQVGGWAANLGLTLGGIGTAWMTRMRLGEFAPYIGRHAADPGGALARLGRAADHGSWKVLPGEAGRYETMESLGKWGNRAGGVVTGALSGWEQWQADSDNPALDTSERVGRAATKGAATGLGAWGGAVAGGEIGGAIGTFICPGAGTVVGGAIGGIVGGIAGSELGGMAGDYLMDTGADVAQGVADVGSAIGDGVSDAAGAVGDAAGAVGDAASDVGDAISFWN
jgi:uncharacterized protein YukE